MAVLLDRKMTAERLHQSGSTDQTPRDTAQYQLPSNPSDSLIRSVPHHMQQVRQCQSELIDEALG